MSTRGRSTGDRGGVAVELVAAVGLLLLPTLLLVASLPTWSERRHTAVVAAREAAAVAVEGYPRDVTREAAAIAEAVAEVHGVDREEIDVRVAADLRRGGSVTATVTIEMPALAVPFLPEVGAFRWTTTQTRRIDDYRSG